MGPLTIHAAAAAIRAGALTPVDLLEQCLERIDVYEPHVRAWVVVDRDGAREQAKRLTDELKKGQHRGPLHGIPIGVKDIIDVFDLPTACGSKLWANSIARQDATVVKRLRQAGAVILGKTVTTAYAFLDPPVTRNPCDLSRTPGGSSSGSAAAVACAMCLGALGTQTGGSLTRPASFCGVCSLKPTHERVPVDGILPLAPSLDHVGVMARCVKDLRLLFPVIANTLALKNPDWNTEYGRPTPYFDQQCQREQLRCVEDACDRFRAAGHAVKDMALPAAFAEVLSRHGQVMAAEAAAYHAPRLRHHPDDYPPRIRELVEEGLAIPAPELVRAETVRRELRDELHQMLFLYAVLVTPAAPGPAPDPSTTGNATCNAPWSFTGLPTVSVPAAATEDGLPMAVQLVTWRAEEASLLAAALEWEAVLDWPNRLPPVPV